MMKRLLTAAATLALAACGDQAQPAPPALGASPQTEATSAPPESQALTRPALPETGPTDAALPDDRDSAEYAYRMGRYDEALAKWRAAAESGDRAAAYRLGVEYMDGKPLVVKRDFAEARKWFEQAAQAGDPRAQFDLGTLHEFGYGVEASLEQAARWYKASAEGGHPQGQYNTGTMYEAGEGGFAKDPVEALKWYMLAAAQGFRIPKVNRMGRVDSEAPDVAEQLRASLPPEQVAEAERRASAFVPRP